MPISQSNKIIVAISCGDAAGISYEVVFKTLVYLSKEQPLLNFVVVGDWRVASFNLRYLKIKLKPHLIKREEDLDFSKKRINFLDLNIIKKFSLKDKGKINRLFGKASLKAIEKAYTLIRDGKADCLVTAPVNKKAVSLFRKNFKGHTEFLAMLSKMKKFAMMITGQRLKVTLVTRHIPLRKVASSLKQQDILSAIELTSDYLRNYSRLKKPKLVLCALNPHGGEEGSIGKEEKTLLWPVVKKALKKNINVMGPLPSDAVFQRAYQGEFDAVICLYHDQGLIPLRMIERELSVNITLGLPFIRTSPAHGTAYDIAYENKAKCDSFCFAVKKANEMARQCRKA